MVDEISDCYYWIDSINSFRTTLLFKSYNKKEVKQFRELLQNLIFMEKVWEKKNVKNGVQGIQESLCNTFNADVAFKWYDISFGRFLYALCLYSTYGFNVSTVDSRTKTKEKEFMNEVVKQQVHWYTSLNGEKSSGSFFFRQ